jgi:hypothetical protein
MDGRRCVDCGSNGDPKESTWTNEVSECMVQVSSKKGGTEHIGYFYLDPTHSVISNLTVQELNFGSTLQLANSSNSSISYFKRDTIEKC